MATGPTDVDVTTDSTGPTGFTGATGATGSTGPMDLIAPVPDATGPSMIVTIEELLESHGAVVSKEAVDKTTLAPLMNESRETLRAPLFQWAAAGFPAIYIVQTFTVTPPQSCADGIVRSIYAYIEYLIGMSHGDIISTLNGLVEGMSFSYSYEGNTLRIHVTKN